MIDFIKRMLGISNDAEVKKLSKIADTVIALEDKYLKYSDEELKNETSRFKDQLSQGKTLDDILPEAFAVAREAAYRALHMRPYPVQVIGGIALHQGRIAEMKTGEGKTLVATMPAYLNALTGNGVHIVTVNDYLAKRDSEWMGKVYKFLGLSVGVIVNGLNNEQRREAYSCDITYGTNNEFGFDYLRDNMLMFASDLVQRGHNFAIVDEVDSILIDEARTPLIISGSAEESSEMYSKANAFVQRLTKSTYNPDNEPSRFSFEERPTPDGDYIVDEKQKTITLTEEGASKAEKYFNVEKLNDIENTELHHHILQALKANVLMKRDVDYVVKDGEVLIVDEFTGRIMIGRRYSDGLHQAIEAKERVKVARESKTLATITFQNYFRLYKKLSGMTGTAKTEEEEFQSIYGLDVVVIPTNKPNIRKDLDDLVYKTKSLKFENVVNKIIDIHSTGQPILVGTINVEISEKLSSMLNRRGIKHEVLNAKQHEREAQIVAQAGHIGAVTIATNMAGRGTDILLGGNPEFLSRREMQKLGYADEVIEDAIGHSEDVSDLVLEARDKYNELYQAFKQQTDKEHEEVMKLGGLFIIGTEKHESRRIDNQLRGRAGRQGDPGCTQFFLSLEDDLLRLFGGQKVQSISNFLKFPDDEPIAASILTNQIENAQKNMEGRNFQIRKNVLQFDDVMNKQRTIIYSQRQQVLHGEDMRESVMGMIKGLIDDATGRTCSGEVYEWDLENLSEYLEHMCIKPGTIAANKKAMENWDLEELRAWLLEQADEYYKEREALFAEHGVDMREVERITILNAVNERWMDHIDAMDQLREGIYLRSYAQHDPVTEYRLESFDMFDEMVRLIREDTVKRLYLAKLVTPKRDKAVDGINTSAKSSNQPSRGPAKLAPGQTGMNQLCPCGSGKKYKHCCGKKK